MTDVAIPQDDVTDQTTRLDDAFDRMAAASFELPNGFVNHGAMACEALAALGLTADIDNWAAGFARLGGTTAVPVTPVRFNWEDALGDYGRLPEWIGHFQLVIEEAGWPATVEEWVPRLLPGLGTVLFHGIIRTAHAVRAIDTIDTPARRGELTRALGYWAARDRPGAAPLRAGSSGLGGPSGLLGPSAGAGGAEDAGRAVIATAADAARHYLARPTIPYLHGITGAMAMSILTGHLREADAAAGLAQLRGEQVALHRGAATPDVQSRPTGVTDTELARRAADSRDAHQVKLVEACRRGYRATADPVFAAAAETVTGSQR